MQTAHWRASCVADGPDFESRIKNEQNNAKFSFLQANDPFHAYYREKVVELGGTPAAPPGASAGAITAASTTAPTKKAATKTITPVEPPKTLFTGVKPVGAQPLDLDVIQLTAQFVAANGRSFLTGIANRETRNPQVLTRPASAPPRAAARRHHAPPTAALFASPWRHPTTTTTRRHTAAPPHDTTPAAAHSPLPTAAHAAAHPRATHDDSRLPLPCLGGQFDFLKPTHHLFATFTALVDSYSKCLTPSPDVRTALQKDADDSLRTLARVQQ
jgi:hypothetical protein